MNINMAHGAVVYQKQQDSFKKMHIKNPLI